MSANNGTKFDLHATYLKNLENREVCRPVVLLDPAAHRELDFSAISSYSSVE